MAFNYTKDRTETPVRFSRSYSAWAGGEVAWFSKDDAARLVSGGVAEILRVDRGGKVIEPKPEPKPEPAAKSEPTRGLSSSDLP